MTRAIERLLRGKQADDFRASIEKADEIWTDENTDPVFRIAPINFVSGPQRWEEFPPERRPMVPRDDQVVDTPAEYPEPTEDSEALEQLVTRPTIVSAWDDVRALAEADESEHSFKTWFSPTRAIAILRSGAVLVLVPNKWFAEWLRAHYGHYLTGGRFLLMDPSQAVRCLEGQEGGDRIGDGSEAEAGAQTAEHRVDCEAGGRPDGAAPEDRAAVRRLEGAADARPTDGDDGRRERTVES